MYKYNNVFLILYKRYILKFFSQTLFEYSDPKVQQIFQQATDSDQSLFWNVYFDLELQFRDVIRWVCHSQIWYIIVYIINIYKSDKAMFPFVCVHVQMHIHMTSRQAWIYEVFTNSNIAHTQKSFCNITVVLVVV